MLREWVSEARHEGEHGQGQTERHDLRDARAQARTEPAVVLGAAFVLGDGGLASCVDTPPGGHQRPGRDHRDAQREHHARRGDRPFVADLIAQQGLPDDVEEEGKGDQHDAHEGDLVAGRRDATRATVPRGMACSQHEQRGDAPEVAQEGRQVPRGDEVALELAVRVGPEAKIDAVDEHEAECRHQPVNATAGASSRAVGRAAHERYRRLPVNGRPSCPEWSTEPVLARSIDGRSIIRPTVGL